MRGIRQHKKKTQCPLSLPSWSLEETAINPITTQIEAKLQIMINSVKNISKERCVLTMVVKAVKEDFRG